MNNGAASSSKPSYAPLEWRAARHQIIVADAAGLTAVKKLLVRPAPAGTEVVSVTVHGPMVALSGMPLPDVHACVDDETLAARLAAQLADSPMATRVYIAGAESFLAFVRRTAQVNGVAPDAIHAEQVGSTARDAQCVHCKTMYRAVTHRAFDCHDCGVTLFVRDHYSRRLGAYQAVVIYPTDPNLLVWKQELLP